MDSRIANQRTLITICAFCVSLVVISCFLVPPVLVYWACILVLMSACVFYLTRTRISRHPALQACLAVILTTGYVIYITGRMFYYLPLKEELFTDTLMVAGILFVPLVTGLRKWRCFLLVAVGMVILAVSRDLIGHVIPPIVFFGADAKYYLSISSKTMVAASTSFLMLQCSSFPRTGNR